MKHKSMRMMKLIDIVKKAGPSSFDEFMIALKECKKGFLADRIRGHLTSPYAQQLSLNELHNK